MSSPSPSTILAFEEARHLVEHHARVLKPQDPEILAILHAVGRVLAEPIIADRNFPPFPRATRDGYALRAADVTGTPATLKVVAEAKAGSGVNIPELVAGQAVSIMTGAPVPPGADAVVMVEFTSRTQDGVKINRQISAGENIVPAGAEAKQGNTMVRAGTRLDFAGIAIAAAVGRSQVSVYRKPRVAVLSTGDEVVDIEIPPGPYQIRNSNSYSVAAQIEAAGGEAVLLPIAPDEPKELEQLLRQGLESDLLLIAGGVSMGKYDLVEQALTEVKAEFFFTGAHIQPGKPVVFGAIGTSENGRKYFLGLPGNPISTMVCFELFGRPLIEALSGMGVRKLRFLHAKLKTDIKTKTGLKRFLPAQLSGELESSEVELVRWQGSGDLAAMARADCYIVVPPDREVIPAGEFVPVLLR